MDQYVQNRFQAATNLSDVFRIAQELKKEGMETQLVNKYATLAKSALAYRKASYVTIKKERIRMQDADTDYTSQFNITPEHLQDNVILVDGNVYSI